jgi:hypothetical protein
MSHGFPGDGRLASLSEGLYAVAINVHLEEGHEADLWLQVLDAECINSLGFGDGDYVDRGSLDSGDSSHLLTWAASATELQTAHDAGGICVVSVALERPDPGETKWHILARETIGSFLPDVTRTTQPGQSSPVPSPVIVSTPLLPTATAVVKLLPTATAVATEVANVAAEPPALGDGRTPLATTPWTEVSQTEVRFWFPVESPDSIWVWNRPETRDLVLEYSWAVIFEVSDAYFALAVKNFKSPNGMRGEGRLTDLLDAAQVNVWRLNQPESSSLVAGYVTARVSGEGILFTLYDPELVTWFVEDPPDVVIFETKGSALDFSTQTVSVR